MLSSRLQSFQVLCENSCDATPLTTMTLTHSMSPSTGGFFLFSPSPGIKAAPVLSECYAFVIRTFQLIMILSTLGLPHWSFSHPLVTLLSTFQTADTVNHRRGSSHLHFKTLQQHLGENKNCHPSIQPPGWPACLTASSNNPSPCVLPSRDTHLGPPPESPRPFLPRDLHMLFPLP